MKSTEMKRFSWLILILLAWLISSWLQSSQTCHGELRPSKGLDISGFNSQVVSFASLGSKVSTRSCTHAPVHAIAISDRQILRICVRCTTVHDLWGCNGPRRCQAELANEMIVRSESLREKVGQSKKWCYLNLILVIALLFKVELTL